MANPQHTALLLAVPSDPNPVSQTYTVEATVTDRAGNPHTASVTVAHPATVT
jgi:hypothetical protein